MSKIRILRPGDSGFTLIDGMIISQRASVEILSACPQEYTKIIRDCLRHGWLRPVATVYEHELTFNLLKD